MLSKYRNSYYDYISKGYSGLYEEEQLKKLKIMKANVKTNSILDIGCGSGFSGKIFSCKIIGLDLSFNLLKQAKFSKVLAAAENLPFKDKSFEGIICVTAIHNFKNYKKALLEIKRIMRKSGAISVLKRSKKFSKIVRDIKKMFKIVNEIDEEKDRILIVN